MSEARRLRRERKTVRVMRFAGPRMLTSHPYLAVMHIFDGKRPPPEPPKKTGDR